MRKRPASRRPGRRSGSSGESRDAILCAARELFAERGFRGATTRAIAESAGVDIALLRYFFESKAKLFAAVIEIPVLASETRKMLSGAGGPRGERMARFHVERLFIEHGPAITAMLRAALGDPDCIPALRAQIEDNLVAGTASALTGRDARLRSELAGALMVGLFICRHMVCVEPLASVPDDRLVALVGPSLDVFLEARNERARVDRGHRGGRNRAS